MVDETYRCHQTNETTNVVLDMGEPVAVVQISRTVGNEKARALMRLCHAALNGDMLAAQAELDVWPTPS